jgi:hypothetical protein
MKKKQIIIWGGNSKPLSIDTLDSHASVNAFFLTKYLSNFFNVINITDIDKPELILNYDNIHAIIATSQYGFTNRIVKKGKMDLYQKIRYHISGKLCSIADNNNIGKYYEDILFCVRPVNPKNTIRTIDLSENPNFKEVRSGWCAEPSIFFPDVINEDEFNIFIDHGPYSEGALNYVPKFHSTLKKVKDKYPVRKFNIYHQNNEGLIKWNFEDNKNISNVYDRNVKVPYLDIAEVFKKIHIFCFTHKESAGLSGIEAASAGAKLYIPKDLIGRKFIKDDLLNNVINYEILLPINYFFYKQFVKDIEKGIDRKANHNRIVNSKNTWESAANVIYNTIK